MNKVAWFTISKEADDDGVFSPIVVIDGVGDFPAERLDEVARALFELQREVKESAVLKAKR